VVANSLVNAPETPLKTAAPAGEPKKNGCWSSLVKRIQMGENSALEEMYGVFTTGIRFYLCRHLGQQDLDDRVHEAFLTITQSIRRGEVREPERLMGFVRTVVRRQIAARIETMVEQRRRQVDPRLSLILSDERLDPEHMAIEQQRTEVAQEVLQSLAPRDREVLVRFYLQEQAPADICREMGLSATQFRVTKSRAKERFGEIGRARLGRRLTWRTQN
jgi:RNA polymerase sigma-70 factor, ECF subfamily